MYTVTITGPAAYELDLEALERYCFVLEPRRERGRVRGRIIARRSATQEAEQLKETIELYRLADTDNLAIEVRAYHR